MPKYGACNLSSINISEYVLNPFTEKAVIDYAALSNDLLIYVRAMDDIVTENSELHALPQQRQFSKNYRNIGIGVMGLGDALIKMGIKYGSKESINWLSDVMRTIFRSAVLASNKLAAERGVFPKYDSCIFDSAIIKNAFSMEEIRELKKNGLRNASLISIAPTGLR